MLRRWLWRLSVVEDVAGGGRSGFLIHPGWLLSFSAPQPYQPSTALQALIRPRSKSGSGVTRKPEPAPASPPPVAPTPAPAPEGASLAYQIMKVRPDYPAWFRPLAALAEQQPVGALLAVLGVLGAAFGSGFSLAWLLR